MPELEEPFVVRSLAFENRLGGEIIVTANLNRETGTLTVGISRKGAADDYSHFGLAVPILGH